jgi:hypothetical protein
MDQAGETAALRQFFLGEAGETREGSAIHSNRKPPPRSRV